MLLLTALLIVGAVGASELQILDYRADTSSIMLFGSDAQMLSSTSYDRVLDNAKARIAKASGKPLEVDPPLEVFVVGEEPLDNDVSLSASRFGMDGLYRAIDLPPPKSDFTSPFNYTLNQRQQIIAEQQSTGGSLSELSSRVEALRDLMLSNETRSVLLIGASKCDPALHQVVGAYLMKYRGTSPRSVYSRLGCENGAWPDLSTTSALQWYCLSQGNSEKDCSTFATCNHEEGCKPTETTLKLRSCGGCACIDGSGFVICCSSLEFC